MMVYGTAALPSDPSDKKLAHIATLPMASTDVNTDSEMFNEYIQEMYPIVKK